MAWTAPATWSTDQIVLASGTGSLNEQVRDNFLALDQHAHTGAAGDGNSTLTGVSFSNVAGYQFADQSADPSVTGTIQRNGANILYFDGSTAIDLTAADQAAGTASLRSLGVSGTVAAAGNHQHQIVLGAGVDGSCVTLTSGAMGSGDVAEQDMYNATYTASDNNSIVSIVVGGFVGNNQFGGSSYQAVSLTLKLYIGGVLQQTISGYATAALWPTGYGVVQSLRRNFIGSTGGTALRVTSTVEGAGWTTALGYIRGRKSVYENVITV